MHHYDFSLQNQINWFKKNIKKNYLHNLLYLNDKLIGYNCLRVYGLNNNRNFILFDTVVIKKKYRSLGYSKKILYKSNRIIKKKKIFGILFCKREMIIYYKKYGWKLLKLNKNYKSKIKLSCMVYNLKKKINNFYNIKTLIFKYI